MRPTVEETLEFVKNAHGDQKDNGGMPYWHHLEAVMKGLPDQCEDDWKCAALLHHVLEDTSTTVRDLEALGYSEAVIQAVQIVTRPEGTDYLSWIGDIRNSNNAMAIAIKTADLAHNMDPGRFHNLDPDVRNRLRQKYRDASIIMRS